MAWPESIDAAREVEIETSRSPGATVHRTTIWAVVDDGEVYVRSWLGETGRWYQEVLANPDAVLHAGGEQFPVRAIHSPDDGSVAHASAGPRAQVLRLELVGVHAQGRHPPHHAQARAPLTTRSASRG